MKKVLIVLTNESQYGNRSEATGLWLGEATEFVYELEQNGIAVDYVSPKGGYVPIDPRSLKYASEQDLCMYADSDFRKRALAESLKPTEVEVGDYSAIYFTGGHGVMWDFPYNEELHQISWEIYQQGGYLTSVCHGISGLLFLKDDQDQYVINGKRITGFTNSEEVLSGKLKIVPFLNEEVAKLNGAIFTKKRAYAEYAVQDGQLITGQNPFSPTAVAKLLVRNLQK